MNCGAAGADRGSGVLAQAQPKGAPGWRQGGGQASDPHTSPRLLVLGDRPHDEDRQIEQCPYRLKPEPVRGLKRVPRAGKVALPWQCRRHARQTIWSLRPRRGDRIARSPRTMRMIPKRNRWAAWCLCLPAAVRAGMTVTDRVRRGGGRGVEEAPPPAALPRPIPNLRRSWAHLSGLRRTC